MNIHLNKSYYQMSFHLLDDYTRIYLLAHLDDLTLISICRCSSKLNQDISEETLWETKFSLMGYPWSPKPNNLTYIEHYYYLIFGFRILISSDKRRFRLRPELNQLIYPIKLSPIYLEIPGIYLAQLIYFGDLHLRGEHDRAMTEIQQNDHQTMYKLMMIANKFMMKDIVNLFAPVIAKMIQGKEPDQCHVQLNMLTIEKSDIPLKSQIYH